MEKKIRLFILASVLIPIFYGCSSDMSESPRSSEALDVKAKITEDRQIKERLDKFKEKRYYNTLASPYLKLSEYGLYILDITQEDAEKIGIPKEAYKQIKTEIEETNENIRSLKVDGQDVETPNPQDPKYKKETQVLIQELNKGLTPLYYSKPTVLSGRLTSNGQEKVYSGTVWAPGDIKAVRFKCQAAAAITPMFTCATYSSGSWQQKTKVGILGAAELIVPLYVSNDYINLQFQTTDSNGGYSVYSGVKR